VKPNPECIRVHVAEEKSKLTNPNDILDDCLKILTVVLILRYQPDMTNEKMH
jgi:hypothetical protein